MIVAVSKRISLNVDQATDVHAPDFLLVGNDVSDARARVEMPKSAGHHADLSRNPVRSFPAKVYAVLNSEGVLECIENPLILVDPSGGGYSKTLRRIEGADSAIQPQRLF